MSRVATFLTHLALYVSFLVASAGAQAQGSTLSLLVGEWNHVGSGSVGGHNILVRSTGNNTADVFQSNAPMARVAGGVIQAGGNFAFEGRDNQGKSYRCVYYITFYADRLQSNWRVTARSGNFKCPEGLYARIAAAGDPRLPEADLIRLAQLVRQNRPDVLTADDGEKLVLLRTSLRVTQGALERFFRVLGEDNVPPEKLAEKLEQKAQAQQQLIQQANALNPDDPAIKVLRDQALAAIDAGRYDEAKIRLARASEADLAAIRRLQGVAEKRLLSAAEAKASLGRIALIESQYRQAATYFRAAFDLAPANHTEVRRNHRMGEADAWYRQGDEKGDNDALGRAISLNQEVLRETPRARAPLDWAGVQNELGIALWTLGQREGGATRLEEAVAAFREASKERTRERVPLDWARTQNNIGIALLRLGERESGSARLEDAVGALREALTERTRERVPLDWATTQTNLGIALLRLGERDSGVGRLEEALAAFRATLSVYTR
jgi:tetratricopeptide (TPR) repeat protein